MHVDINKYEGFKGIIYSIDKILSDMTASKLYSWNFQMSQEADLMNLYGFPRFVESRNKEYCYCWYILNLVIILLLRLHIWFNLVFVPPLPNVHLFRSNPQISIQLNENINIIIVFLIRHYYQHHHHYPSSICSLSST